MATFDGLLGSWQERIVFIIKATTERGSGYMGTGGQTFKFKESAIQYPTRGSAEATAKRFKRKSPNAAFSVEEFLPDKSGSLAGVVYPKLQE